MPTLARDFFVFFGLDRRLIIDPAHLQKRFYELSREWHPDKFTRRSKAEQEEALEASSILNDGYRTLKEPASRAEYLLTQEGQPIAEQRGKDVPPELLEEVFELNMALEEARGGDESARSQLEEAKVKFNSMQVQSDHELEVLFRKYDAAVEESQEASQALAEIRNVLNRRRYTNNLIRDVNKALNPAQADREPIEDKL